MFNSTYWKRCCLRKLWWWFKLNALGFSIFHCKLLYQIQHIASYTETNKQIYPLNRWVMRTEYTTTPLTSMTVRKINTLELRGRNVKWKRYPVSINLVWRNNQTKDTSGSFISKKCYGVWVNVWQLNEQQNIKPPGSWINFWWRFASLAMVTEGFESPLLRLITFSRFSIT